MLYKFKSKATGDLILLEPQGKQILRIIGKDPGAQGIILPNEMLAAIDALQAAYAAIGLQRVSVSQGPANLMATLQTPRGWVTLESQGV